MELLKIFIRVLMDGVDEVNSELEEIGSNAEEMGDKSGSAFDTMGSKFSAAGDALTSAGKALMPASAAMTALGGVAVKTTMDFDTAMSQVAAVSGATGEDLQKLRDKAREMGANTKFSATEAAEAFNYMAMAGWKTDDMLNGIEGILNLAAASGTDLATTSDIVTDALTAMGYGAEDAGKLADVMAAASSNANTNVQMMGETFKYVAPLIGAMGYDMEDTAVAIGLMANSGIKSSQAGTALRSSLSRMVKPTKEMNETMAALGLITEEYGYIVNNADVEKAQKKVASNTASMEKAQITYNDAVKKYGSNSSQAQKALISLEQAQNRLTDSQKELEIAQQGELDVTSAQNILLQDEEGNQRSLAEVMGILREKFAGLTETEQAQAAATLFGQEAMSGMLAIINASDEDFNKLTGAVEESEGTAENMASVMQDNLGGQITILKSQLQELAISFGEILMPTIRKVVSWVQKIVDKFNKLSPRTKEIITKIAALVAVIGPLLIVGGKIISGIGVLIGIVPKLLAVVKLLFSALAANPIGLVVTAVAALVAGFIYLWNNCEGFRNFFIGMWDTIKETVLGYVEAIRNFLSAAWETIKGTVTEAWEIIKGIFSTAWEFITTLFTETINGLIEFVTGAFNTIKDFFTEIWNGIKDFFTEAWEIIKGIFTTAVNAIKDTVTNVFNAIKTTVTNIFDAIKTTITSIWEGIKTTVSTVVNSIKTTITNVFTGIKTTISTVVNGIKTTISTVFESIKSTVTTIWNGIKTAITSPIESAKNIISGIIDKIKGFFNFEFSWPSIPLPHFGITPEGWKVGDLLKGKIPHLGIEWYAKGGILNQPTIFDYNPETGTAKVGGEQGAEAVAPIDTLLDYVRTAVREENGEVINILNILFDRLFRIYEEYFPMFANAEIKLDSGALVGEMAPGMDKALGKIADRRGRG